MMACVVHEFTKCTKLKIFQNLIRAEMKECFYSILGVDKKADDDVIKKAYRQMALKHHPDKQTEENREKATARFQLISEAYEVLSNAHERAWYDSHKEQILHGDESRGDGSHSTREDIWKYFSTSCFNGKFDDSEGGFYRTYGDLFEELSSLESQETHGSDSDSDAAGWSSNLPSFGYSKTEWEDVQSFYSRWSNFQSSRHFMGFEKWNLRDGENRQVRRAMQVENKKARNAARKEYSSAVRSLVDFVKRRDVRVIAYQAKQAEIDRLAAEQKAKLAAEKERQKRIAREAARKEEELRWAEIDRIKKEKADQEGGASPTSSQNSEREEDAVVDSILYCPACRKNFKSEKSYENHENSKKHKLEVAKLRELLLLDDEVEAESRQVLVEEEIVGDGDSGDSEGVVLVEKSVKAKRKNIKKKVFVPDDFTEEEIVVVRAPEVVVDAVEDKARSSRPRRRAEKDGVKKAEEFKCKVCGEIFPPKSALFRHLNDAGHHSFVDTAPSTRTKKK